MPFEELQKEIYFPYQNVRDVQSSMISDVYNSLKEKKHIIMHAPTGIGKTISALAPALSYAIKNNLTIFFLTSRQTQHKIVVDTLKQIKQKFNIEIECADIIGKKSMCLQSEVDGLGYSFHEYCKSLREGNLCEFYTRTRSQSNAPTFDAKLALEDLKMISPCHVHEFIDKGKMNKLCPYELAALTALKAKVIVADYYYIFNKVIRNSFFTKTNKQLDKSIIIVDEAHNLPARLRNMLSENLSSQTIEYAKKEAQKFGDRQTIQNLNIVEDALFEIAKEIDEEDVISRISFYDAINKKREYDDVLTELLFTGKHIMDMHRRNFIYSIGRFLEIWLGPDAGYGRILAKHVDRKLLVNLTYGCLDPSLAAKEVIEKTYSTILMSGTLIPTSMYKDLLGFKDNVIEKQYKNPFPKKNRLNLIIPRTTTKFKERNNSQFNEIARICSNIATIVEGNLAMFFPSYELMLSIYEFFKEHCKRPVFIEKQSVQKHEKESLLNSFKSTKDAILFGNSTGSFGEGIDMPGVLKAVVIVGLPLQKPDTEVKLLIEYYDDKYGSGMEYGYVLPAITKCLQNAGRCIRSETDNGAIIFLDERYAMSNYYSCFPSDWDIEVDDDYMSILKQFFKSK